MAAHSTKFVDSITKDVAQHAWAATFGTMSAQEATQVGQMFIREEKRTGFAIRVVATGAVSFVWEGRVKGSGVKRRVTIGQWPDCTVASAKSTAAEYRGMAAKRQDPAGERIVAREQMTFGELVTWYLDDYAKPHRKTWETDARRLNRLKGWNRRRLVEIGPADVLKVHTRIGEGAGRVEANRTTQLLRSAFNTAIDHKKWKGDNPAAKVKLFKENKRKRFLTPDELVGVNEALLAATTRDWKWRAYFPLMLMTGLRKSELTSLRWENVDLKRRTLELPETKSGEPHLLPIPAPAVQILEGLPSRGVSPWVFPARRGEGHVVNPSAIWDRIRTRAGVKDVTIHDLRRTLGSWLAADGYGLPLIGKALNHANPASTAIYARLNLDPVRVMLEKNAQLMFGPVAAVATGGK
jgi:integrase